MTTIIMDEQMRERPLSFPSIANDLPLVPEIWLQILAHLLPPAIKSTSLTCRLLRQMAQPLLFRSLTIRPYFIVSGLTRCLPHKEAQWFLQKLHFCSSNPLIAPAIRRLHIRPHCGYHIFFESTSDSDQNYNLILDEIFKQLPKFVNLFGIACYRIWCTSKHLIDLSKLGTLGMLDLTDCGLEIPTGFLPTFRVLSLEISSQTQIPSDDWISFFHPDSASIIIGNLNLYSSVLPDLVTSVNTVRHLQRLSTIVHRETLPLLVEVLSHSPPLQSLRLNAAEITKHDIRALSFTPLPLLSTFQGPYELLRAICSTEPLRKLRDLELSSLLPNRNDDPNDVMLALSLLGEATTRLEKLRFSVKYLTENILKAVVSLCDNLRKLSISAVDQDGSSHPDAYTSKELFRALEVLDFPPHIEILSIEFITPTYDAKWTLEVPLRDYLVRKYPTLQAISFTGASSFTWNAPEVASSA